MVVLALAAMIGELGRDGEPAVAWRSTHQAKVLPSTAITKLPTDEVRESFTNSICITDQQYCNYLGEIHVFFYQTERALLLPPHLHPAIIPDCEQCAYSHHHALGSRFLFG